VATQSKQKVIEGYKLYRIIKFSNIKKNAQLSEETLDKACFKFRLIRFIKVSPSKILP
jgi:hypothetical protein